MGGIEEGRKNVYLMCNFFSLSIPCTRFRVVMPADTRFPSKACVLDPGRKCQL